MNNLNADTPAYYRNGILVLLLVAIALIVHNIYGQNGYLALRRQQTELHGLLQEKNQLQQENEQLEKENRALKSDPSAIERPAREQLHLAKPGETIYMLPEKPAADSAPGTGK